MHKLNIKILAAVVLVGLLSGCSSKNENVMYNNKAKEVKSEVKADSKISDIQTKSTKVAQNLVESNLNENSTNSNANKNKSYINEVVSIVDGEKILLRSIHFGFDKYKISDEMIPVSNENVSKINKVIDLKKNLKVKLEGNCDEWGTDEYNYALGLKRTKSVKNELIKNGIASDNIVVVSYGESNPICTKQTAKCWKQNRRVDYKLLP